MPATEIGPFRGCELIQVHARLKHGFLRRFFRISVVAQDSIRRDEDSTLVWADQFVEELRVASPHPSDQFRVVLWRRNGFNNQTNAYAPSLQDT